MILEVVIDREYCNYRKWWVWTAAGTTVATATGIVVWALLREPPDEIGGEVDVR